MLGNPYKYTHTQQKFLRLHMHLCLGFLWIIANPNSGVRVAFIAQPLKLVVAPTTLYKCERWIIMQVPHGHGRIIICILVLHWATEI